MLRTSFRSLSIVTASLASIGLSAPLAAQMGQPPAPELEKFAPALGTWEGEGSVFMESGAEPMPWTGTVRMQKALKGYVIRDDTTIDMGAGGKMAMLSFFAWDKEAKQFVQMTTSSMGGVQKAPVDWVTKNKFVSMATIRMPNMMTGEVERSLERWTSTFSKDGKTYEILGEKAVGDGTWFKHVTGKFTKTTEKGMAVDANTQAMMPAPAEMGRLAKLRGTYDIAGTMRWGAGEGESMPIKGNERIEPIFQGHVLSMRTIGEPSEGMPADSNYEALGFASWNPIDKCYRVMYASNMGEHGTFKMYASGKHFVTLWMGTETGIPNVKRSVWHCDDKGQATRMVTTQMTAASKPFTQFDATYKIRKN